MKSICKLSSLELACEAGFPLHVYPQSADQGWEITKIRIFLHRSTGQIRAAINCYRSYACKTHENVRLHIVTDERESAENMPAKAGSYERVASF